ncbi:hypothetical protein HY844_00435 [Candidatus Berkelbacteria bacterium]|nr:hypothetical protein [Candidatus Berkelbacteria bacterium]
MQYRPHRTSAACGNISFPIDVAKTGEVTIAITAIIPAIIPAMGLVAPRSIIRYAIKAIPTKASHDSTTAVTGMLSVPITFPITPSTIAYSGAEEARCLSPTL